jgi:hypothetical protein
LDAAFRNHKDLHTWLKGDWVSIWNKDQSVLRGMARLEQLKNLPKEYKRFYIFLENLPEDIQADDIVINEEVLNRGTLVRNCSNSAVGTETASNRFRASGIRFENNHFEDFQFLIEFNSFWATPRSRNVEVVNTFIGGGESYANLYSPMAVTFNNCQFDGITFTGKRNAKNILLKDIKWTNSEKLVKADPYAEIYLKGNIKADDKKLSDQELAKRSSVNKDSLIQFPNGKELKQSPPVKKSKHPKPELN